MIDAVPAPVRTVSADTSAVDIAEVIRADGCVVIENLAPPAFEKVVARALREGTAGEGRGFVLMPSAAPYGRTITPTTLANYETMVRLAAEC